MCTLAISSGLGIGDPVEVRTLHCITVIDWRHPLPKDEEVAVEEVWLPATVVARGARTITVAFADGHRRVCQWHDVRPAR